jgi:hypothetical protein
MLSTKNVYANILDIKYALSKSHMIIESLERENYLLKKTLRKLDIELDKEERAFLHYEHIHNIRN